MNTTQQEPTNSAKTNVIDPKANSNPFGSKSKLEAISAVKDLSKLVYTLAYGDTFTEMLKDTFRRASIAFPAQDKDCSYADYIGHIGHLILDCPIVSISTTGMTESQKENHLSHYDRTITVNFEKSEQVIFLLEWSLSDADGLRFCSGLDILLNGISSKQYFKAIQDKRAIDLNMDLVCQFLRMMIEDGGIQKCLESDLCDISDDNYKKYIPILESIINI
jgi:hypothetical protein